MLVAPAATAGAICLDRARGTLAHVMATDLSDSEIVLGKLAARLLPVMGLVACTWPVMAISTLLGGIDPTALTLGFAIIVTVALLGCAIALALSVWARKPHEVILATYAFWLVVLMAWPVWYTSLGGRVLRDTRGTGFWLANPFYLAFAPYSDSRPIWFLGLCVVFRGGDCQFGHAGVARGLADAACHDSTGKRGGKGSGAWSDRPDGSVASRPFSGWQPRALARVAPLAAVSLDDAPGRASGWDNRTGVLHRGFRRMEGRRRRLWCAGACSVGRDRSAT